ncbi:hypothetical protein LZ023_40715 (plasmid) [Pseudomonas silvicola]|nr:hypothetical protein LZ023_40990 [Pseudomonas silvicola]WAH62258.1 hypothetical protein LZ023_40715 [Pseudomonas silvicola]
MNHGGNYCGHVPDAPRLELVKPVTTSDKQLPGILIELQERVTRYYSAPNVIPSLRNANLSKKGRQQRSERRESCLLLLRAIISRTDLVSLRCGVPTREGFMSLTLPYLVEFTGLPMRRAERAMADLKRANLITVAQPRQLQPDGSWRGLAAVKAVNRLLFTAFGLGRRLQNEKERASDRLAKKIKKAGGTLTGWARNALVLGGVATGKAAAKTVAAAKAAFTRPAQPRSEDFMRARLDLLIQLKQAYPDWDAQAINAEVDRRLANFDQHTA